MTNIGFIKSHFDWKVLKLESCLQVIEASMFGFGLIYMHDKQWVQGHFIKEYMCYTIGTQIEYQVQNEEEDEV